MSTGLAIYSQKAIYNQIMTVGLSTNQSTLWTCGRPNGGKSEPQPATSSAESNIDCRILNPPEADLPQADRRVESLGSV